ncbi:hypothetical protein FSS13T_25230 [Flavobacterium saliperosum S13]|nr:hypothetical protein FSS13T_25230 [Flavobacterium saliperosum S13]
MIEITFLLILFINFNIYLHPKIYFMAKIMVPEQVFPGFKIINQLNDSQLDNLIGYLNNLDIGKFYGDIAKDLSELLIIDGDDLLRTLLSFTELLSGENVDIGVLSKNLAESYKEFSRVGINTKETNKLKANLLQILSNFNKIQLTDRVREYKVENSNNFRDFKLLTDLRFMQTEEDAKSKNYGIILHKLYIEYQNSIPRNELHLHVGIDDLIELKAEIEKAIERDKMLRESFSGDIKLI